MEAVNVRKEDELLMNLVHYFVTKENYAPIYVHGVKDEIWLENVDGPYRVIRINSSHIINEEQFKFDQYKIRDILHQIKKKTLSFKVNALNINLNEDSKNFDTSLKNIDNINIHNLNEFETNKDMLNIFPNIKNSMLKDTSGLELIFNVTRDINSKTEKDNKTYEAIFSKKKPIITYIIMGICIVAYLLEYLLLFSGIDITEIGKISTLTLRSGEIWRLITYAFLHGGIAHILCNMYSLYIIGPQIESKYGKGRFLFVYMISAIVGGLLSAAIMRTSPGSIGASGAIFGLMGSMIYFGIRFRLYLKDSLVKRILPIVGLNLLIGYITPGIDNACHVGGLIAGFLASMAMGIPGTEKKSDTINGIILLLIFTLAVSYLAFIY